MREYSNIPHYFGLALQQMRHAAGLSQEALAERAGIDRSYASLLEQGKRQPSIKILFQLADALNVPVLDFIQILERDCPHLDP